MIDFILAVRYLVEIIKNSNSFVNYQLPLYFIISGVVLFKLLLHLQFQKQIKLIRKKEPHRMHFILPTLLITIESIFFIEFSQITLTNGFCIGYYLCFKFQLVIGYIQPVLVKFIIIFVHALYLTLRFDIFRSFLTDFLVLFWLLLIGQHLFKQYYLQQQFNSKSDFQKQLNKQSFYKDCFDIIPTGIVIYSKTGGILYNNKQSKQFFQCTASNLLATMSSLQVIQNSQDVQFQINNASSILINKKVMEEVHLPQSNQQVQQQPQILQQTQSQQQQLQNQNYFPSNKLIINQTIIQGQNLLQIIDQSFQQQQPQNQFQQPDQSLKYIENNQLINSNAEFNEKPNMNKNQFLSSRATINAFQKNFLNIDKEKQTMNLGKTVVTLKARHNQKIYQIQLIKIIVNYSEHTLKKQDAMLILIQDVNYLSEIEELKLHQQHQEKLLAQTSHEFRTPLNCSILMLEKVIQLLEKQQTEIVNQYLYPTLHSQKLLLNLIHDILDFSQINAGKFTFNFQKFNLRQMIQQAMQLLSIQASVKKIQLLCDIDPRVPRKIINDSNRLRQIILNLISNALKFTKQGYIKLQVELINHTSKLLQISVIDTGVGIKKEQQDKLFKFFGKLDNNDNKRLNSQGVGLGLVISQILSIGLGPKNNSGISVESEFGVGTTFKFLIADKDDQKEDYQQEDISCSSDDSTLKLKQQTQMIELVQNSKYRNPNVFMHENMQHYFSKEEMSIINMSNSIYIDEKSLSIKKESDSHALLQSQFSLPIGSIKSLNSIRTLNLAQIDGKFCDCPKVLVVDDNQFNILVFQQVFSDILPNIETAYSGEEALEKITIKMNSNCCKKFIAIFMDIQMPGMSGYQATKEIKNIYNKFCFSQYYIIGCSGYENEYEKQDSQKEGMDYYLQKPIDKQAMKRLLKYIYREINF